MDEEKGTASQFSNSIGVEEDSKEESKDDDSSVPEGEELLFTYASQCKIVLDQAGNVRLDWNNGAALEATRGATVDYIKKWMFIHLSGKHYDMGADYNAMVAGGVLPTLAWIIALYRRMIMALKTVKVNVSETVVESNAAASFKVSDEVSKMMKDNAPAVYAILQQAYTVFVLNGESLVSKGHHYLDSDSMWDRFFQSTGIETHFSTLKINNWQGPLLHDAFHPFDYDWVAKMVSSSASELVAHINGVAAKRLGVLPAGTTTLGLVKPMLMEIAARNKKMSNALAPVLIRVDALIETVRSDPLNYCSALPRAKTMENLRQVDEFGPILAFMYGYLQSMKLKGATALAAKSLTGVKNRNQAAYTLGTQALEAFPVEGLGAKEVLERILVMITAVADADDIKEANYVADAKLA